MKREYKGRSFNSVAAKEVPMGPLPYDLYIYLPLNARMLKIRAKGQEVESAILASYMRRGHEQFYFVEGAASAASWESAVPGQLGQAGVGEKNPNEFQLGEIQQQNPSAYEEGAILSGGKAEAASDPAETPGDARAEKGLNELEEARAASAAEADALLGASPDATAPAAITSTAETEESSGTGSSPEEGAATLAVKETGQEDPALNLALGSSSDEAAKLAAAAADEESSTKIGGGAESGEEESTNSDQTMAEEELSFGAEEEAHEAEQPFDANAVEAEIETLVKSQSEPADDSAQKIAAEIEGLQEALRAFAADEEEFVEDVKKIESGEEKALAGDWALAENSPQLKGLSKEEKAGAKLAFALGKKLGQLRGELNAASRTPTNNPAEEAELAARKEELGRQIKKLEATSMILESLDDKDIPVESPELAGKGKVELLGRLEEALGEIAGSALLSEEDSRAISKKIKRVKAEDFGVHGEKVDELRETLAQRRAKAEYGAPIEKVARKSLNRMIAREVKAAKVGTVAARELAAKRQELSALLDRSAASPEESLELENRARKLQENIVGLESLSVAVEAGEDVPDAVLQSFSLEVDPDFELKEGETEEDALLRVESKLQDLKAEVVEAKQGAAEAQKVLLTKINGETGEAPRETLEETGGEPPPELPELSRLESIDRMKAELAQCAEELGAGAELDEQSLGEIYAGAAKAAREAAVLQQVDAKVAEKRAALRELLREKPSTPEQKAELQQKALAAMTEISGLERLQEDLSKGAFVAPERLKEFSSPADSPAFRPRPGESAKDALDRMGKELAAAGESALASGKKSEEAEEELRKVISGGDSTELKVKALNSKPLAVEEKYLSRILKSFLETGKPADANEVWEVKRSLAANARLAQAERNVAKKISGLAEQLKELAHQRGGTLEEVAGRREKMESLQNEVWELKKLGESIEAGKPDYNRISPFLEEVPESLVLKGDKPTAENMAAVIQGIGALRDEVMFFKGDALRALEECKVIAHGNTPEGAEENMARLVSGEDGRQVQAGVYAATFLRSFGYEDPELEFDLMKALFLAPYSSAEVKAAFPGRVAHIHAAKEGAGGEMLLQDMAEAVRLSRAYLQIPGVITGKVSLDPAILKQYCAGPEGAKLDSDLLARLRQSTESELTAGERIRLSDMAHAARAEISQANLTSRAS